MTCSQRQASSCASSQLQADHVDEQPLGEPVLAHDPHRQGLTERGELEVTVALDGQQTVALHPGNGLADGGTGLVSRSAILARSGTMPTSSSS